MAKPHIPQELIDRIARNYPNAKMIRLPEKNPQEVIFETGRSEDGSWSTAVAIIKKSRLHFHHSTVENYFILEGDLKLEGGDHKERITCDRCTTGDQVRVSPGRVHRALAGMRIPVVLVLARPAWRLDDHIFVPEWT